MPDGRLPSGVLRICDFNAGGRDGSIEAIQGNRDFGISGLPMEGATATVRRIAPEIWVAIVRSETGLYIEFPPRGSQMEAEHDLRIIANRLYMAIDYTGVDATPLTQRGSARKRSVV